jgi:hypothetical protein
MATISLDDSEYQTGLSGAKDAASQFGSTVAGGFASAAKVTAAATAAVTGAMVAGAASTASYGDDIDKMSQKMGMSAEAYQEWDFIMQHAGTSIDALKPSMKTLATAAENGSDAFEKLGISEEELATLSQEDLFGRVIEGLQGMEEGTERTALTSELLGRGATELGPLLNQTAAETEAMKTQVHELGGVMSDEAVKASAAYQDSLQNMQTVFGGLKNSLMGNFLPSMTKVMDGVSAVFSGDKGGAAVIAEGIGEVIDNITETIPQFLEAGEEIIDALVGALTENLPQLAESALEIITTLVSGIIDQLPQIVEMAVQIISLLVTTIAQNLPMIIEAAVTLITTLATSLANEAPTLVPVILDAVILIVQTLIQNAPLLLEAALTLITALAQGLIDYIPELIDRLPEIIASIVETLVGMSGEILSAGIELLIALGAGLIEAIPELIMNIPEILTAMVDGLLEGLGSFAEVGADLIEGLWNGIQDAKEWIMDKIAGFADDVLDGIKDFFGIHSPSTEMAEIGDYMAQGLAKGWDDSVGDVIDKMNDDMDLEGNVQFEADTEGFDETPTFAGSGAQLAGAAGDIIIPVYIGQTKLDEVLVRAEQLRNYRSGGR